MKAKEGLHKISKLSKTINSYFAVMLGGFCYFLTSNLNIKLDEIPINCHNLNLARLKIFSTDRNYARSNSFWCYRYGFSSDLALVTLEASQLPSSIYRCLHKLKDVSTQVLASANWGKNK